MLVLLRFVFGSAGASGFLGFSVDFRRAALARASSAVLRVCYRWSCPPISPNSLASVLPCMCNYLRCRTCDATCALLRVDRTFSPCRQRTQAFSISTKGVSRAGGYARAPAACAPSCVCCCLCCHMPCCSCLRCHVPACAHIRARWSPAAIAGHPAAAHEGSPVCITWHVSRFRAGRRRGAT